jgi:DNA-binding CsgD family transcriptional regulator
MAQLSQQVRDQADLKLNLSAELTERQMEVLELVHQGLANEEISERLYISVGTVKNHVHNILKALEAKNREQASYWYALRQREPSMISGASVSSSSSVDQVMLEISTPTPIRETVAERLASFCVQLNWSIGHVFMHDHLTNQLVPTHIWYLDDEESYREFQEATSAHRFPPSEEDAIPNILFSPEPVWIADVRSYPGYDRAQAARSAGIQSGLILPLGNEELIGVMEFYSTEKSQPDPHIVANIIRSSQTLGPQIEARAKAED